MKNIILLLLLSPFFFSCQQKGTTNPAVAVSDTTTVKKRNTEVNKQIGDTIVMKFLNNKSLYTADGVIDTVHPKIYVKFTIENSGELNARIIPEAGKGNIHFNQIIFPDASSDGPFGMDLKIPVIQKGNYILVIGHSQMANDPYRGKFAVELRNTKE
jgi:hypothetical protein